MQVLSNKKREESAIPIINFSELKTPKTSKTTKSRKGALKSDREDFISSPILSPRKGRRNSAASLEDIYGSLSKGTSGINICTPSSVTNPGTPGSTTGAGGDLPSLSRTGTRCNSTPIIYSHSTVRRKPQPIERKLKCTLEELLRGCEKKIKITRDVISGSGYGHTHLLLSTLHKNTVAVFKLHHSYAPVVFSKKLNNFDKI